MDDWQLLDVMVVVRRAEAEYNVLVYDRMPSLHTCLFMLKEV